MTTRTKDPFAERQEYGQQIMDRLVAETSTVETSKPFSCKDDFLRILENKLEKLKSIIDDMSENSRNLENNVKAEFERENKKLHQRYEKVRSRLNDIRQSGEDAWKELHDGALNAWQDLAEGIKNAVGKFN